MDGQFTALEAGILKVLDAEDRIPAVTKRGSYYYNFWRDKANPRGLLRRTTWESYLTDSPAWEIVLDVDALAAAEGIEWVYAGSAFLRPADGVSYRRAMLRLSPDGGDAVRLREFDVEDRTFVDGGFDIPVAKSYVSWLDQDRILLGTDFGPGSLTTSSYPRTSRILRRGQDPAEAQEYFDVPADHMLAQVGHDSTPGFERDVAVDVIDFFNYRTYLRRDAGWLPIDVPTDVNVDIHRQWLLMRPQGDWELGGSVHPAGSLLAADLEAFLAGDRSVQVLFAPDAATSLQSWSWTKNYLLLNLLHDVSSQVRVLDPAAGWSASELRDCPPLHAVDASAVDDEESDDYWLVSTGYLTPSTLSRGTIGGPAAEVKASPSYFEPTPTRSSSTSPRPRTAPRCPTSRSGPKDLKHDGGNPVLLSGYGGFEIARTPGYSGTVGRAWLEQRTADGRGGVYVVANIRGGGEYGPGWHRAALQANRHRAYEDFAAVAQDLTDRGVTRRGAAGLCGRIERRPAGGQHADQLPAPVRRGLVRGAAAGHGPLHQALRRLLLDCGVWGPGGSGPNGSSSAPFRPTTCSSRAPSILTRSSGPPRRTTGWVRCRHGRWPHGCWSWAWRTSGSTRRWRAATPAPATTSKPPGCRHFRTRSCGGR